jgi:hypothetical protein
MAGDVDNENIEFHSCLIHFEDVRQSTSLISQTRLNKVISCPKRWMNLEGDKASLCRKSHELFSDEHLLAREKWYMHENCYKRICDENKIKKNLVQHN